jgi:hypothetical protein
MPIRRIFNISEKLKKASEAHAGQSEELMEIHMGINRRRRKLCNVVFMMMKEERPLGRRGLMTNAESLWKGLECEE